MANTTTSPNMNLPVPIVGTDPGPDWANNINACMSNIDSHTHTSGQGVPITPAAINVNADLPVNDNNLTGIRTSRYQVQTSNPSNPTDLACIFVSGVDLYYIDGAGNVVRITQGGSVSGSTGTITGLPSGTASAAFAAGTFTFQSATNTPATMSVGPVIIAQAIASGKGVTISANGAQVANYNITLPAALPGSTQYVTSDNSGNFAFTSLPTATNTTAGISTTAKKYFFNTAYTNGTPVITNVSNLGAISTASNSWLIPYQTSDGSWNVKFNFNISTAGATNGTLNISGITFLGSGGGISQAVNVFGVSGPSLAGGEALANTGNVSILGAASQTVWAVYGDLALQSKPTWAD